MFKDLIDDLQGLADKSGGADLTKSNAGDAADTNIAAAADTGGDANNPGGNTGATIDDGEGGGEGDGEGGGGEGDGEGELSKSFEVTLEDGSKFKALDATELVKSLNDKMGSLEAATGEALGLCVSLIKSLHADNVALHAEVAKLAKSGTGRVSTLAIVGKEVPGSGGATTMAKSDADKGMKPEDFLAKSEVAFNAQKITGRELATVEAYLNRGAPVPQDLIRKVLGS